MACNIVLSDTFRLADLTLNRQTYLSSLDWRLSTVNAVPDHTLGNGQFTEVTDSGYAPVNVTFPAPTLNGSAQGQMVAPLMVWTLGHTIGDYTVYVLYGTDPADSNNWKVAALQVGGIPVLAAGQQVQWLVTYLLDQLPGTCP